MLSSFSQCLEPLMKNSHSFLIYYIKLNRNKVIHVCTFLHGVKEHLGIHLY